MPIERVVRVANATPICTGCHRACARAGAPGGEPIVAAYEPIQGFRIVDFDRRTIVNPHLLHHSVEEVFPLGVRSKLLGSLPRNVARQYAPPSQGHLASEFWVYGDDEITGRG